MNMKNEMNEKEVNELCDISFKQLEITIFDKRLEIEPF